MARVELAEADFTLGARVAQPQRAAMPTSEVFGAEIGQTVERAAGQALVLEQRAQIARQQEAEAEVQRRDAADRLTTAAELAQAREELRVGAEDIADQLRRGELPAGSAQEQWGSTLQRVREERGAKVPQGLRGEFERGLAQSLPGASAAVRRAERDRNIADNRANLGRLLESLQRDAAAGKPGAVDTAITYLEELGGHAGYTEAEVQSIGQKFVEGVAYTRAFSLVNGAKGNLQALAEAEKKLAGPDFAPLDPQKRAQLVNEIEGRRTMLLQRAQIEADRREARAERALASAQRQLSSGVPLTADAWSALQRTTAGTSVAGEFGALVQSEREIQTMLRQPLTDQLAYVQRKQADLATKGGTMAEAANLQRLTDAVQRNVRTLQQDPLQFAQMRAGVEFPDLPVMQLATPAGGAALRDQVVARVSTIAGLRRQYGDVVPLTVLKPQEAKALGSMLQSATPAQQVQMFSQLRTAAGADSQVFRAMMQQIAPDSPVKALAGVIGDRQANVTTERNWITSDVVRSSGDVAATLLRGEAILSPGKDQAGQDGKPRANLFMPDAQTFNSELVRYVGQAFAERPQALQVAQQAALAYYVGRASEVGRLNKDPKDIDTKLVREALAVTLGEPVERNGGTVFAPWGMSASEFEPKARDALRRAIKAANMPETLVDRWPQLSLRQASGDTYYVTDGRSMVVDAQNRPLTIRVPGPGDVLRDSRGVPLSAAQIPK